MRHLSINPATGRRIAAYPTDSAAQIGRKLERADAAQRAWARLTAAQRAAHFDRLAGELRRRRDELAAIATDEMGKPATQSRAEVEKCASLCDFYAAEGPRMLKVRRPVPALVARGRVTFEPLGVILAIMPWNFPYWQVLRAAVPAMLGGNGILLKQAPNVTGCALAIGAAFEHAGFPSGVFLPLVIGIDPVPKIISDPRIRGVTLTGSARAGRAVAAISGAAMKPGVFELGGSDPVIVLADADLDRAADIGARSRTLNSGQSCICAKRFIVVNRVRRAFEAALVERIAACRVGDPTDPSTQVGPLARADLRDHLVAQVRSSTRRGARVLLAGGPLPGPGFFYSPAVLADVGPGMAAFEEETFGPVAAIVPARDEDAAIRLANATSYGLGAAIFTRQRAAARRLVPRIEAGCVFVNDLVRSSPDLPFGGVKQSGYGRELGEWGLHSFMNVKTVVGA